MLVTGLAVAAGLLLFAAATVSHPSHRDAGLVIAFLALACIVVAVLLFIINIDTDALPRR